MNRKSAMTIAAGVVMALMAGVVGVSRNVGQPAPPARVVVVQAAAAGTQAPIHHSEDLER